MKAAAARGRVLIVAGSDSGGGAGIQADIKTVTALGGYAMTAVTALTAQNTQGVFGVVGIDPNFIVQQMRLVLDDIGADAVKTGMLHNAEVIEAVCSVLEEYGLPLIADPVMFAKGGHALLEPEAMTALRERLIPLAQLLTPNLPEAESLIDGTIRAAEDMPEAAKAIAALGAEAVLLKGGHLEGDALTDILHTESGQQRWDDERIATTHTHGTGCTLASAIATGVAQGMALPEAVDRARSYVREAILSAPGFGKGHGPLGHGHTVSAYPNSA
ncbi:MAG: bifunctional hydroxymethylpyrimidine kinase/phosphomethylpyrimidine kinase [Alphaproteobacteria bacterium]|nr:bifunctional hydroxymethylpyrimidine kinase/phosphomethylpyrimidine kinase [Alphaproteobacteria bacterium]